MRRQRYPQANKCRSKQTLKGKFFLKAVHDEHFSILHSGRSVCVNKEENKNLQSADNPCLFSHLCTPG